MRGRKPTFAFFTSPLTTVFYPLSLHDALPISRQTNCACCCAMEKDHGGSRVFHRLIEEIHRNILVTNRDRKSTRLNSSHVAISYAVFCLKKEIKISHLARIKPTEPGCATIQVH